MKFSKLDHLWPPHKKQECVTFHTQVHIRVYTMHTCAQCIHRHSKRKKRIQIAIKTRTGKGNAHEGTEPLYIRSTHDLIQASVELQMFLDYLYSNF